jgi:hypothetical protein
VTKGERAGAPVTVAILYGSTELCPVRALRRWQDEAGITEGAVFRRIWTPPHGRDGRNTPLPRLGSMAIDAGTVARIIQARAAAGGFDPAALGGHSLKRGALSTGMARGVHPTRLKQLGRHKIYAVLDAYLELGDPFEGHPLTGVLWPDAPTAKRRYGASASRTIQGQSRSGTSQRFSSSLNWERRQTVDTARAAGLVFARPPRPAIPGAPIAPCTPKRCRGASMRE